MQFNSSASNQDLYSDARTWCGIAVTDTTTYPLTEFTRDANFALDEMVALAMRADGTSQVDDANYTNLPLAYTAVTSGQSDYTNTRAHLKLHGVRIQDSAGNWITLTAKDRKSLTDSELAETGTPRTYDLMGSSVVVNPTPNYSVANDGTQETGLELEHQRGPSHFTTSDTTKEPGFAKQYDRLVSMKSAKNYCERNDMEKRVKKLTDAIMKMEESFLDYYSSRNANMKVSLQVGREDYGQSALSNG